MMVSKPYVSMANAVRSVLHRPKTKVETSTERASDEEHAAAVSAGMAERSKRNQIKSKVIDD
jgi:hypothetical protein